LTTFKFGDNNNRLIIVFYVFDFEACFALQRHGHYTEPQTTKEHPPCIIFTEKYILYTGIYIFHAFPPHLHSGSTEGFRFIFISVPLVFALLKSKVKSNILIKTDGRVLSGRTDANIGTADQLLGGKNGAKGHGKAQDTNGGVGGRITQPCLLEGGVLESSGSVAGKSASSDTVIIK